jgi:hypothetical protein
MTALGIESRRDLAIPIWLSGLSQLNYQSNTSSLVMRHTLLRSCPLVMSSKSRQFTHGVLTISAPRARSITSFSRLILAGSVMIHWYPFSAHAIASPIPDISTVPHHVYDLQRTDQCYHLSPLAQLSTDRNRLTRRFNDDTFPPHQCPILLSFFHHPLLCQVRRHKRDQTDIPLLSYL